MLEIKPPEKIPKGGKKLFLGGSIEQGKATDWQKEVVVKLKNTNLTILNPRRDSWDKYNWKQSIDNPDFRSQVDRELSSQESADIILMYFEPGTLSPVSMIELGLFAKTGKLIVVCPNGFWRKGNIDIICKRYRIMQKNSIEEAIELIKRELIK